MTEKLRMPSGKRRVHFSLAVAIIMHPTFSGRHPKFYDNFRYSLTDFSRSLPKSIRPWNLIYRQILENTTSESYASDIRERITPETHEDEYYSDVTAACDVEHGTSHVSVLSPDGNAVAVTSTINM